MVDSFPQAENKENDSDKLHFLMRQLQVCRGFFSQIITI